MHSRTLYWIELAVAVSCAALAVVTTVWPDWIERLTGWEPDGGDGSTEWELVLSFALVSVVSGLLARWQRRRLRAPA